MIGRRLSHYRVLSELGRGGMGVVYKGQDERLPRFVALKVLRTEYAQDTESRSRFLREARAAAVVEHPYIATIYEADEEDDTLFIAMEYVEGATLRSILREPLPMRDALRHAVEIAEGLTKAHRARVIHRDLKPDNIMVSSEGHAKILDFGLAKLLEKRDEETSSLLSQRPTVPMDGTTQRSVRLGTPAYMSPEQVRASDVDHRSDLFAFGATLYEIVTQRPVFRRENQADTLAAILRDAPPSPALLNPEAPAELEWILEKCLAKDPRDRYQDTRDLVVDLEHLRWKWESGGVSGAPTAEAAKPSETITQQGLGEAQAEIASKVEETPAPFDPPENRKTSKGRQLVYGLFFVVLATLAIVLIPRLWDEGNQNDVFYERGLHYLHEEGESVRSLDDAIQMFHRAVAADSSSVRAWARLGEAYWMRFQLAKSEASREEAERAVARAIALDPSLPEALNATGRGFLVQREYEAARDVLLRAVETDAKFAAAWANLGRAHQGLENYAEGLDALGNAIRLEPQIFRHRVSLGNFYRAFGEFEGAAASYREAIDLKPNSRIAWNNLGSIVITSAPAEAADAFKRVLEIDKDYGPAWTNLGTAYYFMEDYEAAEESYRRAVEVQPRDWVNYRNLADALVMLGKEDELRVVYAQASELARSEAESKPNDPEARIHVGIFCARAGDVKCAVAETARAEAMQPGNASILFRSATVYAILDRLDTALDRLEQAVKFGLKKAEIENDPDLGVLRENPRYKRILELAS